jgi:uncharacterized protein YecE (DUF72 family)
MLRIGTCGWDYPHWRRGLYPDDVPHDQWLHWYAEHFGTVEVDSLFYRLPQQRSVRHWLATTPDDFVFALKASRYLTHVRRLQHAREPLQRLQHLISPMDARMGPLLLQLPRTATVDLIALGRVLAMTSRWNWRVVVEPRHDSWFTDALTSLLAEHNATCCWTDWWGAARTHPRTSNWGYVRLHAGRGKPLGAYGEHALNAWLQRIGASYSDSEDVFVFFNNDAHGCAPRNAARLGELAARHAMSATRTPASRSVPFTPERPASESATA